MEFSPEQLCWSADVPEGELLEVLGEGVLPPGMWIKLDRAFFERSDKGIIGCCQDFGYKVFADAKIIEVPTKVLAIADAYLEEHPDMLNVMAGACSTGLWGSENANRVDALARFADACAKAGTRSCAVTVLTSKSQELVEREFNGMSPASQVMVYVDMLAKAGITDVVCSPREARVIRAHLEYNGLTINTPGVRLPGTDVRDQSRVTTPAEALSNGANMVIIGSNLTDGDEPDLVKRVERNYARLRKHLEAA